MKQEYYFEISEASGRYYAITNLPGLDPNLKGTISLGTNPNEAADSIVNQLNGMKEECRVNIRTEMFYSRLQNGRGGSLTRWKIEDAELERIVRKVSKKMPQLKVS